ncbi:MAG: group II intron reverse transcriptase/maturase [Verrucomicrobia bacterium]|nr:group II intron reverse transcriptase/maturase [Verrucomicrobiota bacterium]
MAATPKPPVQGGEPSKTGRADGEVGVLRRSEETVETQTTEERREGTWVNANANSAGSEDGRPEAERLFERITTPTKIQKLQRTLYRKAKAEPKYRFYSLYGELLRKDLLETAMRSVAHNNGAAGVDGQTCEVYLKSDEAWDQWLEGLLEELRTKSYRPSPVRRVYIPKGDGKMRPLGIPTVKDRVVQTAVALLLLPILEADSHPNSYAYRPQRGAHQAMEVIGKGMLQGRVEVIDADLSGYFDSIPHGKLLSIVARRIRDGAILKLIKGWLRAPIVEPKEGGPGGGGGNACGTPQGGVISPLLANAYLNALDWEVNERCELKPVMVRYADDFVILSRPGQGQGLMERLKGWLERRGFFLNEKKTRLVDIRQEGIKFLGFALTWRRGRSGRKYPHVEAHPKSLKKLRDGLREKLNRGTLWRPVGEVVRELNRKLKGWAGYFHYGNSNRVMSAVDWVVCGKLQRWLWRKHGCTTGLWSTYTAEELHERFGLYRMPGAAPRRPRR